MGRRELWLKAKRSLIESYRDTGFKTEQDVYDFVRYGLYEPRVGTKHNCTTPDHVSPMQFVSDALLDRVRDYIVWANRGGSKSYLSGLITWTKSSFTPNLETVILGGSLEQSEKAYNAMTSFWDITNLQPAYLFDAPNQRTTEWRNKSRVHILCASTRSTRGPHPQSLIMDEIDEMDEEVYNSALSQPQSKYGIPASLGKLSTNHYSGGVMDKALAKAQESNTRVYKWCVWECLQSCRDYSCSTCKLTAYCPGQHMKDADGYYRLEDFISKLYHLSLTTLQLEWLCIKIGRDDLIYGQFDLELHSSLNLPGYAESLPVLLSIDWGGTSPFSVGAWQKFDFGWVRIDEVYMGNTTNSKVLSECKLKPWWSHVVGGVADPSRVDLIGEWAQEGIRLMPANNAVQPGIDATRNAMRPLIGAPLFFVNRRCQAWINEVLGYREKGGRPVKEMDHAMDETRYFTMWQMEPRPARSGTIYHAGMKKEEVKPAQPAIAVAPEPPLTAELRALKEKYQPRLGRVIR